MSKHSKAKKILAAIILIPILIAGFGYVVMQLWNWLIPELFNGPVLTFWQTLGLLLLSKILFGGFKGGSHDKKWKKKHRWDHRYKHMSSEEKEAFKRKWAEKWRWGCPKSYETAEQEKSPEEK